MDHIIQESHYRFIFEYSFDAILLTSPDGKVYRANKAACEIFQRDEDDLRRVGRDGVVDTSDSRLIPALKEREEKGKVRAVLNLFRKDGTKFPADCTSAIFRDSEGKRWTAMIIRDMTAFNQAKDSQNKVEEETKYFATHDYVTGILNRRAFVQKLEIEMARSDREKKPLCLILIDLDYFKQVNDQYGHLTGDEVLRQSARRLGENLRPYDILGRFGGDEFIVCLPDTDLIEAASVAERLRSQIQGMEMRHNSLKFNITASLGVVCYLFAANEELDAFISRADDNMFKAKSVRNSVYAS